MMGTKAQRHPDLPTPCMVESRRHMNRGTQMLAYQTPFILFLEHSWHKNAAEPMRPTAQPEPPYIWY